VGLGKAAKGVRQDRRTDLGRSPAGAGESGQGLSAREEGHDRCTRYGMGKPASDSQYTGAPAAARVDRRGRPTRVFGMEFPGGHWSRRAASGPRVLHGSASRNAVSSDPLASAGAYRGKRPNGARSGGGLSPPPLSNEERYSRGDPQMEPMKQVSRHSEIRLVSSCRQRRKSAAERESTLTSFRGDGKRWVVIERSLYGCSIGGALARPGLLPRRSTRDRDPGSCRQSSV